MGPMNFLDLPVELICHVLSYLRTPDLLCCTLVSYISFHVIKPHCVLPIAV